MSDPTQEPWEEKRGPGYPIRPGPHTPEIENVILRCFTRGLNDRTAADLAGVTVRSIAYWRRQDPEFDTKCRRAKAMPKYKVAEVLYRKATGIPTDAPHDAPVNIENANLVAAIFWGKVTTEEFQEVPNKIIADETADDSATGDERFL